MGDTKYYRKTDASAAVKWDGENLKEVLAFTGKHPNWGKWFASFEEYAARVSADGGVFKIISKEFVYEAVPGDWIVRSLQGYNYVMKPDVFAATFVPALDAADARDVGVKALTGIDQQVMTAAADLDAKGKENPAWAFIDYEANAMSFGRWAKCGPNPAPYIRADIALSALHPASPLGAVTLADVNALVTAATNMRDYGMALADQKYHRDLDTALAPFARKGGQ